MQQSPGAIRATNAHVNSGQGPYLRVCLGRRQVVEHGSGVRHGLQALADRRQRARDQICGPILPADTHT